MKFGMAKVGIFLKKTNLTNKFVISLNLRHVYRNY